MLSSDPCGFVSFSLNAVSICCSTLRMVEALSVRAGVGHRVQGRRGTRVLPDTRTGQLRQRPVNPSNPSFPRKEGTPFLGQDSFGWLFGLPCEPEILSLGWEPLSSQEYRVLHHAACSHPFGTDSIAPPQYGAPQKTPGPLPNFPTSSRPESKPENHTNRSRHLVIYYDNKTS
jgi:hypothetical protein